LQIVPTSLPWRITAHRNAEREAGLPECQPAAKGPKMTPVDLLIETGEKLHGPNWMARLSDDLGVNDSTVRFWVNGKMRLRSSHPIMDRLVDLIDLRMIELNELRLKFLSLAADGDTLDSVKSLPQR